MSASNSTKQKGVSEDMATRPSKAEKIRLKNSRAQKKYREKKQEEKRTLERSTIELIEALGQAEAQRDALSSQISGLQTQLRRGDPKASTAVLDSEPVYIPADTGYEGLHPCQNPGLLLRVTYHPPKRWTYAEAMNMTLKDHCDIRREMVLRAGQLLLANLDRDMECREAQELKEVMMEVHGMIAYLALLQPTMLYHLIECRADTMEYPVKNPPPGEFWRRILMRLKLSEEQEEALLERYLTMREQTRKLLAERERLRVSLVEYMDWGINTEGLSNDSGQRLVPRSVHWASLVRAVQENLDNSHVVRAAYAVKCSSMWTKADGCGPQATSTDIFQDAQLLTLSWPYFPSKYLVIEELARMRGHRQTEDIEDAATQVDDGLDLSSLDLSEKPYVSATTKILADYRQHRLKQEEQTMST